MFNYAQEKTGKIKFYIKINIPTFSKDTKICRLD